MNHGTEARALPPLIADMLHDSKCYIDNLFADIWKKLKFNAQIVRSGFNKRTGVPVTEVVFLLLVWKWIDVPSIAVFSRRALGAFSSAKKDVMYDLLRREDINWRELHGKAAKALYDQHHLGKSRVRAFVLDDSIKARRGKKMEGVSSHFDHVSGRHVMGQQVLALGLSTEEGFVPLDSQIYVSQTKAQGLVQAFKDQRSVAAKRYTEATSQSKPQMAAAMLKRACRRRIEAQYLLADAWFGTKPMIRTALGLDLTAILRMKKNKMKYRVAVQGRAKRLLTAKELYAHLVKKQWKKVRGLPYQAVPLDVELDLSEQGEREPRWVSLRLLFVRGLSEDDKACSGKKDWALFLTTDSALSTSKLLETYALRWGIEVYFKEAKQHLGFLREQTVTFSSHTASIHLTAIRYLMLVSAKLDASSARVADMRASIQEQLNTLDFAGRLWQLFRAIISGTLHQLKSELNDRADMIMQAIDQRVNEFFTRSLQLDTFTMRLEHG